MTGISDQQMLDLHDGDYLRRRKPDNSPIEVERTVADGLIFESATLPDGTRGTATYSEDEAYRYRLSRRWDKSGEIVLFVMLNPSTATATAGDPTITRCINFAKDWGYGGLVIRNLYALRSTDPRGLWKVSDPVGPENDREIKRSLQWADRIIAAWGSHARPSRVLRFWELAGEVRGVAKIEALRLTKDGHPGHPLYIPGSTTPFELSSPLS